MSDKHAEASTSVPFSHKVGSNECESELILDEEYMATYYGEEKTTFLYSESIFLKCIPSPDNKDTDNCNCKETSGFYEKKSELVEFSDTSAEYLKYPVKGTFESRIISGITATITRSGREVATASTRSTGSVLCKYETSYSRLEITCLPQPSGATEDVEGTIVVSWNGDDTDPAPPSQTYVVTFTAPPPPELEVFAKNHKEGVLDSLDHPVTYKAGTVFFTVKNKAIGSIDMDWTASTEDTSWITLGSATGTNNGQFTCVYLENLTGEERVGTIKVESSTPNTSNSPTDVTITQETKSIVLKNVELIIKNVATGEVVEDATVIVSPDGSGAGGGTQTTDGDGKVVFLGLTGGEKYNVSISHTEFISSGSDYLNNDYFTVPA